MGDKDTEEYRDSFKVSDDSPNMETLDAMSEVLQIKTQRKPAKSYSDVDAMMEDLIELTL